MYQNSPSSKLYSGREATVGMRRESYWNIVLEHRIWSGLQGHRKYLWLNHALQKQAVMVVTLVPDVGVCEVHVCVLIKLQQFVQFIY